MKAIEIIIKYLKDNGFDGLYTTGACGCDIDDFQCCGEDFSECKPGYKRFCDGCTWEKKQEEVCDFRGFYCIGPEKP